MGNLDDAMRQDQHALLDLDEFGEEIIYKQEGVPAKTLRAVVNREEPDQVEDSGLAEAPVIVIEILREDSDDGIELVDIGSDKVTIARRLGETPTVRVVDRILAHDASYWRLRIR